MEETEDDNFESFFADAPFLELDCDDPVSPCPPPLWALPPPPRPPWLSEDSCDSGSEFESCENILILDTGAGIQHTFHNLVIIAVCSAILVILLVFLVACIWRWRHYRAGGCHCGTKPGQGGSEPGLAMELSDHMTGGPGNTDTSYSEVYDNPNYSHIMIGGQPFFILPSGELSDHVPVPGAAEAVPVTPGLQAQTRHIYEPGSYRETSDYDTDSSTFRPESGSVSDTFPPIYEEIDKPSTNGHQHVSPGSGRMRHVSPHVSPPQSQLYRDPVDTLARSPDLRGQWPGHLSPRRPQTSPRPTNSSIYYYSDTLRRRGAEESDSGVSSSRSQNTSSESTPRHPALAPALGSHIMRCQPPGPRSRGQLSPVMLQEPGLDKRDTKIVVKTNNRREPVAKL